MQLLRVCMHCMTRAGANLIFDVRMGATPHVVAGSILLGPTQKAALRQVLHGVPLSNSVACDQLAISDPQCQRSLSVSDTGCLPKCPASLYVNGVSRSKLHGLDLSQRPGLLKVCVSLCKRHHAYGMHGLCSCKFELKCMTPESVWICNIRPSTCLYPSRAAVIWVLQCKLCNRCIVVSKLCERISSLIARTSVWALTLMRDTGASLAIRLWTMAETNHRCL